MRGEHLWPFASSLLSDGAHQPSSPVSKSHTFISQRAVDRKSQIPGTYNFERQQRNLHKGTAFFFKLVLYVSNATVLRTTLRPIPTSSTAVSWQRRADLNVLAIQLFASLHPSLRCGIVWSIERSKERTHSCGLRSRISLFLLPFWKHCLRFVRVLSNWWETSEKVLQWITGLHEATRLLGKTVPGLHRPVSVPFLSLPCTMYETSQNYTSVWILLWRSVNGDSASHINRAYGAGSLLFLWRPIIVKQRSVTAGLIGEEDLPVTPRPCLYLWTSLFLTGGAYFAQFPLSDFAGSQWRSSSEVDIWTREQPETPFLRATYTF